MPSQEQQSDSSCADSMEFVDPARELEDERDQEIVIPRRSNQYSSIFRLHEELLANIFEEAVASQHHASMRTDQLPLNVAQVCHLFRSVALAAPRLWSRIQLVRGREWFHGLGEDIQPWFERRLELTKAVPLYLSLALPSNGLFPGWSGLLDWRQKYVISGHLRSILDSLAPRIGRCQALHIWVSDIKQFIMIRDTCRLDMPRLEDLSLSSLVRGQDGMDQTMDKFKLALPMTSHRLTHLTLQYIILRLSDARNVLGGLNSLHLEQALFQEGDREESQSQDVRVVSLDEAPERLSAGLLGSASNLESFSLVDVLVDFSGIRGAIQFEKLRSLSLGLEWNTVDCLMEAVQHLHAPALFDLRIFGQRDVSEPTDLNGLSVTMVGRFPNLEKLSVERGACKWESVLVLLEDFPLLRVLNFREFTIPDMLLTGLKPRNRDTKRRKRDTLCPQLVELGIWGRLDASEDLPYYQPFKFASLRNLLKSRHIYSGAACCALEKFVLAGKPEVDEKGWRSLKPYVASLVRVSAWDPDGTHAHHKSRHPWTVFGDTDEVVVSNRPSWCDW